MIRPLVWTGYVLLFGGLATIAAYGLYGLYRLLGEIELPLALRVALVAVVAGLLLLLGVVIWERWRQAKTEHFEEVD